MLNGRDLEEIKREVNEPPCLSLLTYKGPSNFPSSVARAVTDRKSVV